jgi:Fic family protein
MPVLSKAWSPLLLFVDGSETRLLPAMSGTDDAWKPVSYEERNWEPALDVRDSSSAHVTASGPYRASVPPLIAAAEVRLGTTTAALATEATAELIRFDTELGRAGNPLIPVLLRLECAASSAIEQVTAPAQAIMLAEIDESLEPHARQIVSHVRADEMALAAAGSLNEVAIVQVQRTLIASSRPDRRGRWRDQQVWLGGGSAGPQRAPFVPPHQSRLPQLMADLIAFARRDDLPALAQIAIAHAQYETVHPFLEVNGRTGRAVMQAMLRRADLTRAVVVPLSAGLLRDTAAYFDALRHYRSGRIAPIVEVFAGAAHTAVASSRVLIDDLADARGRWDARSTSRKGSGARRLVSLLERQPVINSRLAVSCLGVTPPNAQLAIDRLVSDGILVQIGSSRRNRSWAAMDVLDAMDAFMERARRER